MSRCVIRCALGASPVRTGLTLRTSSVFRKSPIARPMSMLAAMNGMPCVGGNRLVSGAASAPMAMITQNACRSMARCCAASAAFCSSVTT